MNMQVRTVRFLKSRLSENAHEMNATTQKCVFVQSVYLNSEV